MRFPTVGLVTPLVLALLMVPLAATTQPTKKVPTIGVLRPESPPAVPDWHQRLPFLQELRHLGWREGENLAVEYRWASGRFEHAGDLAAELVRLNVDVIVVDSVPLIRAVQHATTTIPIVMTSVSDPVAEGFVTSLARPGGNITGVDISFAPELSGKLLQLLTEVVPPGTRIAVLWDPDIPDAAGRWQEIQVAAQALGVMLQSLEVREPEGFARAFDTATREGAGALLILPSILFALHRVQLAALATHHRLPAIFWQRPFAQAGGLLAYGPSRPALSRRAAYYVDRILKGAKPADLPVERPMKFDLIINLKTAEALGVTIPPTLLFQADEVIR